MSEIEKRAPRGLAVASAVLLGMGAVLPGQAFAQMGDDWVTVVVAEEPLILDGCEMNKATEGPVVRQDIIETLTEVSPEDGTVTPRLATSWERVDDTTWRFKLREDVTFHDGAPFTAEAAAYAISRTMDTNLDCETRLKTFGELHIKGVPVDSHTLDVVANQSVPILPTRMSLVGLVSPNTPKDSRVTNPVGTGPYEFIHWKPGIEVLVQRYDGYWGDRPEVAGAKYVWRDESSVRAAMVEIGEADLAPSIAYQDATDPSIDRSYPNSETNYVRIEVGREPLSDVRVRQALNLAFDFEGVRGTLLPDQVMRAAQLVAPSILGHNHELDKSPWPYDPDRARALIADAKADGVDVDQPIWIVGRIGQFPNVAEVLEAMMAMYNDIGLNVDLRMMESGALDQYQNKPLDGSEKVKDYPPILFQGMHDNNLGDAVFTMYNKTNCGGRQSFICDDKVDDLTAKATVTSGPERGELWREAQRRIYEDIVGFVYIAHMVGFARVNERIVYEPTIATNTEVQLAHISIR